MASGVGGLLQRIGSRLLNGLDLTGRFPGMQPKPPVLPLTDPANMKESAPPAVQAAAEIKQEEDAAPQKIMAIRYLATLGCGGCYGKVEDALLEGLSDCTEEVRYEAVKALQCQPQCGCKFCNSPTCCSPKVRKRLNELTTCEKEPSARIRRHARISLACCNTIPLPPDEIPREGPPPPAATALAPETTRGSKLFEGIQLVSFESLVAPNLASDPILANVNGAYIYRSQVQPLIDKRLQLGPGATDGQFESLQRERVLAEELQRVIDWKLLEQVAKNDVYQSSTAAAVPFSPQEIQAWFERQLKLDMSISSQQLLAHYEVNRERYRLPIRLRWECSRVLVDRCENREEALAVAAYVRNRAIGGQMAAPTGLSREQVSAETHEWSELEHIEPPQVRNALRNLQNGQVSSILEQEDQLLLLRMLERSEAEYLALPVVADRIRSEILVERRETAEMKFLAQLRADSNISTVFDLPTVGYRPANDTAVTLNRGIVAPQPVSAENTAVSISP